MAPLKDVQPLTGYIRGGVTLFGARKPYPVYIDETAILFDQISVSAGARGIQLILSPADYLRAAQALEVEVQTADLTKSIAPLQSSCHPERAERVEGPESSCHPERAERVEGPASSSRIQLRRANPDDPSPLDPPRQRPPHRVALPRRHHLHAFLFPAGRRAFFHRLRPHGEFSRQIAGGVLCVATMFASVSALNQAWAREIRHNVIDAQRMAPTPGADLFLAKVIVNFLFVSIVQVILAPLFVVFYNLRIEGQAWLLLLVLPLGTWALVANGIFFAALAISSRNRELLLSLILFPIFIPALLAMVQATTSILTGESDPTLWIKLLLGYDIVFTTASLLLFDVVFHAE